MAGPHLYLTWTAAEQVAWATAMLTGPSDAPDMDTLIHKCSAMTKSQVSTAASAWVSPVDGARSATAGSKADSVAWNASVGDLTTSNPSSGEWIQRLT